MSDELEVIGAASAGALAKDTTGDGYINGPCPNCGAEVSGQYCANCGQSAKDLKRPFFSLIRDMLNDVFSFDGRLWRTLPALMFLPGKITRAYIDGKRMRYVPPFRLFLIASVLFFLVMFSITERQGWVKGDDLTLTGAQDAAARLQLDGKAASEYAGFNDIFDEEGNVDQSAARLFIDRLIADGVLEEDDRAALEIISTLAPAKEQSLSRAELLNTLQKWVPRLSFLLLPFYVLTFMVMHFWIRRIYIFDHMIVALHMQSFFYLAATFCMLVSRFHPGLVWSVFGLSTFVYPLLLMGKAYGTNWIVNMFRVLGLYAATFFALVMLTMLATFFTASDLGLVNWDEAANYFKFFGEEFN